MDMSLRPFLASLALLAAASGLRAEVVTVASGPARVALIELYTSEGCSSCPPADSWISSLRQTNGLWKSYVPIAFHVSYWDHLGWKDRFASSDFTKRQYAYADHWGANGVYTPCFVRNGMEWRPSGRLPEATTGAPGVLTVVADGSDTYRVSFVPARGLPSDLEAHVALLAGNLHSKVTAGENDGSTLSHEFVVVTLKSTALTTSTAAPRFEGVVHLETPSIEIAPRLALAAWISPAGSLEPLQATGGWLRR